MKTRDSPPPVHVHVPETTPVHVHMRRSPSKTPQSSTPEVLVKGNGRRSKVRVPWIPPGISSNRRDVDSYKSQRSTTQRRSGSGHRPDAEETEDEMDSVSRNVSILLKEHQNYGRLKKSTSADQPRDTDVLLRALVEAEIDGVAVANQLVSLKETIDSLAKDKRLSKCHTASLGQQQSLLLEKMEMFDSTNHSLRELLRVWTDHERESLVWSEQKDALMKRLSDSETENIRLLGKLNSKEKEASKLNEHLDFEKENVRTTEELSKLLESTRQHLESQLSRANAENTQLTAQIQMMQKVYEHQQGELQGLRSLKEEEEVERRHQEESTKQLTEKLQEKESQLAQALSTSSDWCVRHSKEAVVKGQMEDEISALKLRVSEMASQLHSTEERSRTEREELRDQIQHLSTENGSARLDNQRLKSQLEGSEEKVKVLQSEARQLKSTIRKHENLVEKYQKKVRQARQEAEEFCLKLEETQKEARDLKVSLEREKEQLRRELQAQIRDLEPLPDRLRRTEQQLRDAQQEAQGYERRSLESSAALSEVRHKVEQQGAQLEIFQQKNLLLQEENNILNKTSQQLERRLEDVKAENKDLTQTLSVTEANSCKFQQQVEEKTLECSVLSRQLQQSLDDANRQAEEGMQKVLAKERTSQSKALDLQSQLSRAKAELSQTQRNKDKMERHFQSQLQNLKDRLEQSDSTNRSLQNYVHFLKTSYGNVFGDSILTS